MVFSDIPGNLRVKRTLQSALQRDRIPHSMIFTGPKGVGKNTMALTLAKALNCLNETTDACEYCSNCQTIEKGNHPDVMVISPEGSFVKIEQIRFLTHTAYLKPMISKKRVFIVNQAEKLKEEAANALLKILEEPPLFSLIILITDNPSLLLPTIISRCQIINFSRISKEQIESILKEKGYTPEKARLLSILAEGDLEKALSLDWEEVQTKKKEAWEFFCGLIARNNLVNHYKKLEQTSNSKKFRQELAETLEFFSSFCRDIILLKEKGETDFLLNPDYLDELKRILKSVDLEQIKLYLWEIEGLIFGLEKNVKLNILVNYLFSCFLKGKEEKYV